MMYEAEVCSRRPCITPPLLTLPCSCHRRRQGRDEFKPAHTMSSLAGEIPRELGNLDRLKILGLDNNRLSGSIPRGIFNISTVEVLGLSFNEFSGTLPKSLGYWLPNLKELYLSDTNIGGVIPPQISNASNLAVIELGTNQFTGFIPNSLGNLPQLNYLRLVENNLTIDPQFSLMTSLANCRYIQSLALSYNPLNAILPNAIGNLSHTLQYLDLENCNIKGRIPQEIGNLSSLYKLNLGFNDIIGFLPTTIQALQSLQGFFISNNRLINDGLCGTPRMHVPPCPVNTLHQSKKDKVVLIVLVSLAVLIVLIASVSVLCIFKRNNRGEVPEEPSFLSSSAASSFQNSV
nr:probable LRR receptor-like serine/threonine-protein kinase At3g47570 isoform X3 [Ipomoea batatas]